MKTFDPIDKIKSETALEQMTLKASQDTLDDDPDDAKESTKDDDTEFLRLGEIHCKQRNFC